MVAEYLDAGSRNGRANQLNNVTTGGMHNTTTGTGTGVPPGNQYFHYSVTNNELHLHAGHVTINVENGRVYNNFTGSPESSTRRLSSNNASIVQVSAAAVFGVVAFPQMTKEKPLVFVSMLAAAFSFITGILSMFIKQENSRVLLEIIGSMAIAVTVLVFVVAVVI